MTAFLALFRKDLLLFRRDRRALVITLATPLVLATFFGFIFGGRQEEKKITIAIVLADEDDSELSRAAGAALEKDAMLKVSRMEAGAARTAVTEGDVAAAVIVPAGFGDKLQASLRGQGERPRLTIVVDPSQAMALGVVRGLVMRHVMSSAVGGDADRELPFELAEEEATGGERYDGFAHSFAGMGVQFVLFGAIEAGIAILNERQRGLWRRVRAAPLARHVVLGARLASGAVIAFATMLILFVFARVVFGVRIAGSLPGFVLVCAGYAILVAAVGLFVAAIGKTPAATRGMSVFVVLVAVMLGGGWVPTFVFPGWLQRATLVVPTRWAVEGLDKMTWRGLGFGVGATHAAVLLGFAAVFGAIALKKFRWDEG